MLEIHRPMMPRRMPLIILFKMRGICNLQLWQTLPGTINMKGIVFVVFLLAGCASVTGGNKPEQAENIPKASGTYSITSLYDGDTESKERAAKWMDAEVKNMCASDYTLLSEESVPTMNPLGEVTFSRLIWEIRCVQQPERAKAP